MYILMYAGLQAYTQRVHI